MTLALLVHYIIKAVQTLIIEEIDHPCIEIVILKEKSIFPIHHTIPLCIKTNMNRTGSCMADVYNSYIHMQLQLKGNV